MLEAILKRLKDLERRVVMRYGYVEKVDYTGEAEWNTRGYIPAAKVIVQHNTEMESPAYRVMAIGAFKDEGFWFPIQEKSIVLISFQNGMESAAIIGTLWSDDQGTPPDEADGNTVVMKWNGHLFVMNRNAGIRLETAGGIKVIMLENNSAFEFKVEHPSGTSLMIDNSGNMIADVVGDIDANADGNIKLTAGKNIELTADGNLTGKIRGNIDIEADGTGLVYTKGNMKVKSDGFIDLETTTPTAGIETLMTHPVCLVTGAPIGGSLTTRSSA